MGVLVLAEVGVGGGDPDVSDQKKLVRQVPGVAMDRHDEGLGEERLPLSERVDRLLVRNPRLLGGENDLKASTSMPREKCSPWPKRTAARIDGS